MRSATMEHMDTRRALPLFKRVRGSKLPAFTLTEDDRDILLTIVRHGVIDAEQVSRAVGRTIIPVRRRLKCLYHHGYVGRPKSQKKTPALMEKGDGRPVIYVLAPKGAQELAQKRGVQLRSYSGQALVSLEHERLVTEFMLRQALSCSGDRHLIWLDQLLAYAPEHKDRRGGSWKVAPMWKGQVVKLWLQPDRIFAVMDDTHPEEPKLKVYMCEIDRGTMPLKRSQFSQTSIFRKFLAYAATFSGKKHTDLFNFPSMQVLFVARSKERAENMRLLLARHKFDVRPQTMFHFTDWSTIESHASLFEVPWMLADGTQVRMFD
jgi:predicted transcriptional regulator